MTHRPRARISIGNPFAARPYIANCPTCKASMDMVNRIEITAWALQHQADGCEPPA